MAKTRSAPANPSKTSSRLQSLPPPVESPPHLVVLPAEASPEARIVSINSTRYFIDPTKAAFYEFTQLSAPKSSPRSWLLAPFTAHKEDLDAKDEGYVLSAPALLLATPVDPLFLLLPCLTSDIDAHSSEYLAASDFLSKFSQSAPHLTNLLQSEGMSKILESRIAAVCDGMEIGDDEKLYAFSLSKLVSETVQKARRMAARPLPASMEDRFVKGPLTTPVLSVRREQSGISIHDEVTEGASTEGATTEGASTEGASTDPDPESQASTISATTTTSIETAATSISTTSSQLEAKVEEEERGGEAEESDIIITPLLRLRTALSFLLNSYIPTSLHPRLEPLIAQHIDWTPLTLHLDHVAKLKKEAQAMRSIGESFSRKRALGEDDETKEEARKRKKDEEAKAKKGVSQGVKKLAKVDRSGMKSLKSFFGAK